MKIQTLILVLVGALSACGPKEFHDQQDFTNGASESLPGTDSKITNGLSSIAGSFIAHNTVAIVANFNEKTSVYFGFCSGVRLTSTLIVTAAHCISKIENMRVVIGTNIQHSIHARKNVFEIKTAVVHNQFNLQEHALERRFYDVALIKLKRELPEMAELYNLDSQFENSQSTSQYLYQRDDSNKSDVARLNPSIAGFGVSFQKNTDSSATTKFVGTLNEAPISLGSFDFSQRIIKLAPESFSQACLGDSGGALFVSRDNRYYLQAIAISIKEADNTDPFAKTICEKESSYLNLDYFKSWIKATAQDL